MSPNDSSQPLTDSLYTLQGKTLSFASEPTTVYLGMPTLWCEAQEISTPLLVKLSEATTWQPLTTHTQGIYQIAGQHPEGHIVVEQCCALLPENFAICVHREQRSIDIMHSGRAYISCDSPLVSHIGIVADGRSIEFNNAETLPETVELIFRWSGIAKRLSIYVPFAAPLVIKTSINTISDIKTLNEARAIEQPQLRELFTRHLLKQLSRNFAIDDWQTLLNLPLVDKEFWTIIKQEQRVLVALLLHLNITTLVQLTTAFSISWQLIPLRDWLAVFSRYKNHLDIVLTETMVKVQLNKHIEKLHLLAPCLSVVEQLLKSWLFNVADDELLFMQSEEAALLISEQLQDEQQQLLARHSEPSLHLLLADLRKDWQHLPKETQQLLPLSEAHQAVLLLPLMSVHSVLTAQPNSWQTDTAAFNQLKAFDELWFNSAFTLLLAYLSQQPFYATHLTQETIAMIDHDENDLVAEIEQQLALTNQEVQGLETDIQNLAGGQEALEALLTENQQLNAEIENLSNIIKKRDAALRLLLDEVKKLNTKIRDIRAELQIKG